MPGLDSAARRVLLDPSPEPDSDTSVGSEWGRYFGGDSSSSDDDNEPEPHYPAELHAANTAGIGAFEDGYTNEDLLATENPDDLSVMDVDVPPDNEPEPHYPAELHAANTAGIGAFEDGYTSENLLENENPDDLPVMHVDVPQGDGSPFDVLDHPVHAWLSTNGLTEQGYVRLGEWSELTGQKNFNPNNVPRKIIIAFLKYTYATTGQWKDVLTDEAKEAVTRVVEPIVPINPIRAAFVDLSA